MMRWRLWWALLLGLFAGQAGAALPPVEAARIEALIAHVEHLQGAAFIRNGEAHTPQEAGEHLRMKLGKAGDRVQSAADFIRLCASKSYLSGKPYQIRFADGRTVDAGPYLTGVLAKLPR